jgi:hypothetical protein
VLSVTCCDSAIQAVVAGVQSGDDYAGNPLLQARLVADYGNRDNWSYSPSTNACTWTAPYGAFYSLDSGAPANVMTPYSVDAAHYGGGCVAGGLPNTAGPVAAPAAAPAAPGGSAAGTVLLAGVGAVLLWYLLK